MQSCDEWVWHAQKGGVDVWSHHEANLMQNRFVEDSPPIFNPARHTVVIAGRPVQATLDGRLVMSHQPCTGNKRSINLVACLSFSGRSRCLARLRVCPPSTENVKETLWWMQRRDQKARARSRASWQNMITCGVLVLAILERSFRGPPIWRLASSRQAIPRRSRMRSQSSTSSYRLRSFSVVLRRKRGNR